MMRRWMRLVLALCALSLWCAALSAQTVRLANHAAVPFDGWLRVKVDKRPPFESGTVVVAGTATIPDQILTYVVGKPDGLDTMSVDIRCALAPGQRLTADLATSERHDWVPLTPPPNPGAWFGGPLRLNGRDMQLATPRVAVEADGAALLSHVRQRAGRMFCVDVWARWYPGQPWAEGEALVTCSNPAVQDLFEDVPRLHLQFDSSLVVIPGRGVDVPLIEPGTQFADGQARGMPLTFMWLNQFSRPTDWASAGAVASLSVSGVGIERLLPDGNPVYPQGFNAGQWVGRTTKRAMDVLHTWRAPAIGIAANSGQTGSQEGQQFVRGEALLPGGVGGEVATYLGALKFANRPCHHLEADGAPLRLEDHPRLVVWNCRPHKSGTDQLGKTRELAQWDVPGGFFGWDRQHALVQTLACGARLRHSRLLQHLLGNWSTMYLASQTVAPALATSTPGSARSVGYMGMLAVSLYHEMRDRPRAEDVATRWRQRVRHVYLPTLGASSGNVWDPRADHRILGDLAPSYQHGVMWWQQSWGSWGLHYGCRHLGPAEGLQVAVDAAEAVLRHAWRKQPNGKWIFWDNVGYRQGGRVLEESEYVEGRGVHRTGWFDSTWAVPGLAVLLLNDPAHPQARQIWDQVASNGGSWVSPGVVR